MSLEPIRAVIERAEMFVPPQPAPLRAVTAEELLRLELPPRATLLAPWLPERGLVMVYALRGVGKTWFSLSAAYAVATGGRFLSFQAPAPRPVLYLDGEMPANVTQERLAAIVRAGDSKPPDPAFFRLLAADLQEQGLPDLSTREGQEAIEPFLRDVALVVVDNLSTLVRNGRENEADSWQPVQDWALRQRREGRSVMFVHHANKGGTQRGTSKREDVLDSVLLLKRPSDYQAEQGARFEVHYEKGRGLTGADALPFEACFEVRDGGAAWSIRSIADAELLRVCELKRDGATVREIAGQVGMSKSKVARLLKKAGLDGGPEE